MSSITQNHSTRQRQTCVYFLLRHADDIICQVTFNGKTDFRKNMGTSGGAVHVGFNGEATFGAPSSFSKNNAAYLGGAVHNEGKLKFKKKISFAKNYTPAVSH